MHTLPILFHLRIAGAVLGDQSEQSVEDGRCIRTTAR
jgi:hypothetical protein